ncbi:MAG: hypothetical protein NZ529_11795, partial [Cytophagaceae bacterium]|nr:hypothetical protein [Cytophagaceae bacterium]MDW8457466.1 hypothetical protein [Cytophagaceae bacterium]
GENPRTNIYVSLPQGFTSANSEVYIRYVPEKAIAFLPANSTLQKFTTDGSNYQVVKGRALKILAVAKINNQYFYAEVNINSIQDNHEVNIQSMTQTDEQGLKNKITQFSNS